MRSEMSGRKISGFKYPNKTNAVKVSQVPETAAQIGQISKRIFLNEKNNRAQNNHSNAPAEAHQAVFILLPSADFFKQCPVARHEQNNCQRQDEDDVIKQKISDAFKIGCLVVQ